VESGSAPALPGCVAAKCPQEVDLAERGPVGGYLEAGAVIAMVPRVLLYVGLQRFYIRGLMSGVVKG
jgi:ABC-type glycerol-3-phosphate transport system permease component